MPTVRSRPSFRTSKSKVTRTRCSRRSRAERVSKLRGLVAVITGAGSGIGRASALAFAEEGACVLAADIQGGSAEQTANQITSGGGAADALRVDVTEAGQVEGMVQRAVVRFSRIDVLFNNAGLPQPF